jgi:hypothetical protein
VCVIAVDRSLESGCKTMFYDATKYVYSKHNANYELPLMRPFTSSTHFKDEQTDLDDR